MRPAEYFEPDELEIYRLIDAAKIPDYNMGPDPFDENMSSAEFDRLGDEAKQWNRRRAAAMDALATWRERTQQKLRENPPSRVPLPRVSKRRTQKATHTSEVMPTR